MIIGIDLGTTNSLSAYLNNKKIPEVIVNENGKRLTPSVVYFKSLNEVYVGELGISGGVLEEEKIITEIKRKIGEDYRIRVFDREYTPTEISALILRKIKKYSEDFLKHELRDIVLTVPAYFSYSKRSATKRAAEIAGFNVLKIINEPTSAALSYNVFDSKDKTVAVIDLGGGTFDITVIEYKDRVQRVSALGGDSHLGGTDFDNAIVDVIVDEFKKIHGIDLTSDPLAMNQLKLSAKKAKEDLSFVNEVVITVPYITITNKGPLHLKRELKRDEFEKITEHLISRMMRKIEETFSKGVVSPGKIDKVLFVGGATRIPVVRKKILEFFEKHSGKTREELLPETSLNSDEAVAMGAAIFAGMLEGKIKNVDLYDITSYYLGVEDDDGNFVSIVSAGEVYPLERAKVFTTVEDEQEFIKVNILQSESPDGSTGIEQLGYFYLENIPKKKAGEPDIDVVFSIDKHGILNVRAVDLDTGNYKEIKIFDFYTTDEFKNEKRGSGIKVF